MAHVLFLTQVLPYPLNAGAKIRAYYVLRQLSRHHRVSLVSFVREDDTAADLAHLEGICDRVTTVPMVRSRLRDARAAVKAALTGRSAVIVRDEIAPMRRKLKEIVGSGTFDVIHADQTSMVQYALYAHRCAPEAKLILDAHNALYRIPARMAEHAGNPVQRWLLNREARALRRYELEAYRRFDHVVFVTGVDRRELFAPLRNGPGAESRHQASDPARSVQRVERATSVIPICVDPAEKSLIPRVDRPRNIVHVGTMFWPPNVEGVLWFAREVFPRVLAEVPDAKFIIVGKDPPESVRALTTQVRRVRVTGYVSDPRAYLAIAGAFIVPLHAGGGMRVKIVDAWCWGVPIAATTVGAEGIDVRNGENILIADQPPELARALIDLLKNPERGEAMRAQGRAWVEDRYNWQTVYPAWDDVYTRVLGT
jgi:glycosyltransferase involved in cell wall biosynthesis